MHLFSRASSGWSPLSSALPFLVAFGLLIGAGLPFSTAEAAQGLRARIFLTQKGIPSKLGESGLLRFVRTHKAKRLYEIQDKPIPERQWRATMVAAFNRPVNDLEFEVLFYDTQDRKPKFVAPGMTVFVSDRSQRTIVQKMRLKRPQFRPNRRMELVVTVRRKEVGRLAFQMLGSEIQRSGQVDFSEEEVQ